MKFNTFNSLSVDGLMSKVQDFGNKSVSHSFVNSSVFKDIDDEADICLHTADFGFSQSTDCLDCVVECSGGSDFNQSES